MFHLAIADIAFQDCRNFIQLIEDFIRNASFRLNIYHIDQLDDSSILPRYRCSYKALLPFFFGL